MIMMYSLATIPCVGSAAPAPAIGPGAADPRRVVGPITLDRVLTCLNDRASGPVVLRGLDEITVSV